MYVCGGKKYKKPMTDNYPGKIMHKSLTFLRFTVF